MKKTGIRFLIVDTQEASRAEMGRLVAKFGFGSAVEAASVADALKIIKDAGANPIELVICDWNMPGTGGIGLLKLVKAAPGGIPVPFIMTTIAEKNEDDKIRDAVRSGVDGYLLKPIVPDTFRQAIEDALVPHENREACFGALVVDDDPGVRELMVSYLESLNMSPVYQAMDGEEAKSLLEEHQSELALIVSDWDMPRFNGLEFLRFTRENPGTSTIPFLIVTSQTAQERGKVMTAIHSSVDAYLFKPFRLNEFKEKVSMAVKKGVTSLVYQRKMSMGRLLLKDGHAAEAASFFNEAMLSSPNRAEAFRAMGECAYQQKRSDEGAAHYRRAMQLNAFDESVYPEFVGWLEKTGAVDEAYLTLKDGLKQMPDSYELNCEMAEFLIRRRTHSEAGNYLKRAFEIRPDGARAVDIRDKKLKVKLH